MVINGSLLKAIHASIKSLAVIIIDEFDRTPLGLSMGIGFNYFPEKYVIQSQQRVIMLAKSYDCPIFFVQMDKDIPVGSYFYNHKLNLCSYDFATIKELRALLPCTTKVINKHNSNAFFNTHLFQLLAQENNCNGVENIVVMGWHSNMCIPATIGPNNRFGAENTIGLGAVDYNLTVLTCQQVLNGDQVIWAQKSSLIKFYTYL